MKSAVNGAMILAMAAAFSVTGMAAMAAETGLTGLWLLTPGQMRQPQNPPLTPAAQAEVEAQRRNARVLNRQRCLPVGMPGMLRNELPFEIVESPERIAIIGEQTALARTIYMNTTKFDDEVEPTWNGNAYGKWEKGVLVVHTGKFNDRVSHIPGTAKGSTSTTITERYRVVEGGKGLTIELTFEDPKLLTKPWTVTYHYDRQPPAAQRWEYVCDVDDPQWNTALGVAAEPKAAEPAK